MSKAYHNDGPTFRPGTMKKPRPNVPSPARRQAESEQAARDAAKARSFDKRVNEVGLAQALGLIEPKPPEPPLRRI
jgi:hypothetical protein